MADRVDRVRPTGMRNDGGIRPVAKLMTIIAVEETPLALNMADEIFDPDEEKKADELNQHC